MPKTNSISPVIYDFILLLAQTDSRAETLSKTPYIIHLNYKLSLLLQAVLMLL